MPSTKRRKTKKGILGLLTLAAVFTGCSTGDSAQTVQGPVIVNRVIPLDEPRPLGRLDKAEDAEAFGKAFRQADRLRGIPDVGPADYEIRYEAGGEPKQFQLWLGASGNPGMLMEKSDTNTAYEIDSGVSEDLRGRIASIRYRTDRAEKNGDVIQGPGGTINIQVWHRFMEQVEQAHPASVQLALYTAEGDPIFHNLEYDGRSIHYLFDNSEDGYGSPDKVFDTCERILSEPRRVEKSGWTGAVYRLAGCSDHGENGGGRFGFRVEDDS